jgi:hypothetical protein
MAIPPIAGATDDLLELNTDAMKTTQTAPAEIKKWLIHQLAKLPADSVVKIKIHGNLSPDLQQIFSASSLRLLVPETMNVSIGFRGESIPYRLDRIPRNLGGTDYSQVMLNSV